MLFALLAVLMAYYTCWLFLQPFVSRDSWLQALFPLDIALAVQAPLLLLLLGFCLVGTRAGLLLLGGGPSAATSTATTATSNRLHPAAAALK
jgi:hypothetical protein